MSGSGRGLRATVVAGRRRQRSRFLTACSAVALLLLGGCASWEPPTTVDESSLRARALSASAQDVRLRAAVMSADESRAMFGVDVNGSGVQPVWIEVENGTSDMLWLLHAGTDPDYFSPLEVAWSFHRPLSGDRNARLDAHLDALALQNPIAPGAARSGVLFTNPHELTKLLNVDLLGPKKLIPFSLFLPVPDDRQTHTVGEVVARAMQGGATEYERMDALRAALERLPCCADGAGVTGAGEPLNVVLVGHLEDLAAALVRRGFRRQAPDPGSSQALFGRTPDFVVRRTGQGAPANWLRLWLAPMRYRGQSVFIGQAGRPVGGRFLDADDDRRFRLHPDVDEARNLLVQDLIYSGGLARLGFARGAVSAPSAAAVPGGRGYHTDGLRAVLFISTRPRSLSEVEIVDWVPYLDARVEEAQREKSEN